MATKEKEMVGLTVEKLEEQLSHLQTQITDSTQKTLMLQGAIQAVSLQIEELKNPEKGKDAN
tara:strand:- start:7529 stop:7714 length:186 start_codon:yes stop_codon:yes gene_type:complete